MLTRDFFPGQPFKDIECHNEDKEECQHKYVCTPSFIGAANGRVGATWSAAAVAVAGTVWMWVM